MTMKVIPPIAITDAMLTSSTVPEAVAATYSGATTYALGAIVGLAPVQGDPQVQWRSLQNSNTGNALTEGAWWTGIGSVYPAYDVGTAYITGDYVQDNTNHLIYLAASNSTGAALTDTTKWTNSGPTNRWKMFDLLRSTATVCPNELTVVITPGQRTNSFAFSGLLAGSYTLTVTSASYGGTIYSSTGTITTRNTSTWYEYFFGEFTYKNSIAFFDIPPYSDAVYTLVLTGTTTIQLGAFVVGAYIDLGKSQYSATSDALNFSSIERDADTGESTVTQRRSIPKTTQQVTCEKNKLARVKQARTDLNGEVAFWFGIDDTADAYFDPLTILGIYKQWQINIDLPEQVTQQIEIEEV